MSLKGLKSDISDEGVSGGHLTRKEQVTLEEAHEPIRALTFQGIIKRIYERPLSLSQHGKYSTGFSQLR
jgi:hypothetical protein